MSTTTLSCGFCGETGHPGEARRPHPHTAQTRGDPPTPSAAHLQAAQGAEAQEVARLLREALAEAGGGALHGAGDLGAADGSAGPRAPQPRAPRHRVQPPAHAPLTALKPRGGGAEADDQARPASGAASGAGPGSILPALGGRRDAASPAAGLQLPEGAATTTDASPRRSRAHARSDD